MQIGELIRGFPEPGFSTNPEKAPPLEILPIRESDKPYQFDFPKFDSNDIQAAIKRTIKDAVLGKLFSSAEKTAVGLFDGFNDNATPVTTVPLEAPSNDNPVEQNTLSYSYSYTFSESFSLDLSVTDNQLSLDLSFSRSYSEDIGYSNADQGIEYSSSSLFEKSLELSLSVDLGENGENPSLLSFELHQSSNQSFTESLVISQSISDNDRVNDNHSFTQAFGLAKDIAPLNQPTSSAQSTLTDDKSALPEFTENHQTVGYDRLLLTQLQQGVIELGKLRSDNAMIDQPKSNSVIQEYILGLR
jgi:hypothetical protein